MQEVSPEEGHLEWETPLYRTALAQYEQALPYADVEDFVAERLRFPERSLVVSVPVRLDSGRWTVFPATACSTRPCSARRRAASATTRRSRSASARRSRCG